MKTFNKYRFEPSRKTESNNILRTTNLKEIHINNYMKEKLSRENHSKRNYK